MSLKTEQEWIACKPLADANIPSWIRAIQADALRYAAFRAKSHAGQWVDVTMILLMILLHVIADELESKRDDFSVGAAPIVPDKDRLFHELIVLVTGFRACVGALDELTATESARLEEAEQLLKLCEPHAPSLEKLKEWEQQRRLEVRP